MKTSINRFHLAVVMASMALALSAGRLPAQTLRLLHSFNGPDGSIPLAGLVLSGKTLYGTAEAGGVSGSGTVFAVNTDGTSFRTLHSFVVSDGASPTAGLVLSGSTLYGATWTTGIYGVGTVFAVDTDGTQF